MATHTHTHTCPRVHVVHTYGFKSTCTRARAHAASHTCTCVPKHLQTGVCTCMYIHVSELHLHMHAPNLSHVHAHVPACTRMHARHVLTCKRMCMCTFARPGMIAHDVHLHGCTWLVRARADAQALHMTYVHVRVPASLCKHVHACACLCTCTHNRMCMCMCMYITIVGNGVLCNISGTKAQQALTPELKNSPKMLCTWLEGVPYIGSLAGHLYPVHSETLVP